MSYILLNGGRSTGVISLGGNASNRSVSVLLRMVSLDSCGYAVVIDRNSVVVKRNFRVTNERLWLRYTEFFFTVTKGGYEAVAKVPF